MPEPNSVYALFHVAAGPRLGHGHLARADVLAAALGRSVALHVRGGGSVPAGWAATAAAPGKALEALRPRVLIVDDPHPVHAARWVRAARRRGVPVVSVHDLGIAPVASDLAIDGSLVPRSIWPARRALAGPRYAVVRAATPGGTRMPAGEVQTVAVSLGGGRHAASTRAVVHAIRRVLPDARVLVAAGMHGVRMRGLPANVEVMPLTRGLEPLFRQADIAILGGGTSLYEAAACGIPSVAVPVVAAQNRTVRAFAQAGLSGSAGPFTSDLRTRAGRVARRLRTLVRDPLARRVMSRRGRATVDGQGTTRVVRAIVSLVETF